MSLTSHTFQIVTILATLLVTAATLLLWNRVRGPRPLRLLSRLGLLSASYLLAAAAALVSINIAYGGLISGWGELWDNLGSTPSTVHGGSHHWPGSGPGFGNGSGPGARFGTGGPFPGPGGPERPGGTGGPGGPGGPARTGGPGSTGATGAP
jgi:hypothetical protein